MRRVRRPKEQEEFYELLVDKEEFGIFQSYKDVFMLAGVVGSFYNRRKSFEKSAETIRWEIFRQETDELTINFVALNDTKDINIVSLENFDEKLTIFEEYAAGGMERIIQIYNDAPSQFVDNLYNFIMDMEDIRDVKERQMLDITNII